MRRSVEQDEAVLFMEWKQHLARGNLPFYPDGMANGSSYWETRPRVLFLLKEVNADKSVPAWNLFDVVGDGSIGPTWTVISYWLHGIHGGGTPWEQLPAATPESRRNAISKLAVVNLNKCGGAAASIQTELWAAAYRDRQFLLRQLRLYAPDIIIACGTGEIAKYILFEEHWNDWNKTTNGMYWIRPSALEAVLVAANHPQARLEHKKLYEEVILGLKEIGALKQVTQ
jgi:hypothetical protein